jgi:hypothetical protein
MTKRTRYFIAAASLIMVASLCTGLVAYYSGGLPLMANRSANEDLAYVPADASVVAYANVRDIMSSEFRQKLRQAMPTGEGRDEFLEETGIDLERDVTSVLAAFSGVGADMKNPENNGILLVRGVFNQGQIQVSATQRGAKMTEYKGKQVISMDDAGVAFLEGGLVAIGKRGAVERAIDAHSGANVTTNAEVMRLIGDVDPNANAWAVGKMDDMQKVANLPAEVKSQMPAVQWFSVTGHVNGGVSGTLRAEASDDKSAENLRAVINGGLALARMQMGRDAKLDAIINSLQMTGTGKTVGLSFNLPSDVIDMLGAANGLSSMHKQFR